MGICDQVLKSGSNSLPPMPQVLKDTTLTASEQNKIIKQAAAEAIQEDRRQEADAAAQPAGKVRVF